MASFYTDQKSMRLVMSLPLFTLLPLPDPGSRNCTKRLEKIDRSLPLYLL